MAAFMKVLMTMCFVCALTYGDEGEWTEFIKDTHDHPDHRDGIISTPTEFASLRKLFLNEGIQIGVINAAITNMDDNRDGQIDGEEYAEMRLELLPISKIA
ncbi:hypothetical protein LOTGIDRAFT_236811 [Lottia gigantea]|uniref:EF-hand domain-containing protein n=1 Tax=Lottia gigantea TaxID=225164 RepID=V4B479_LOTGI|nr:hypothetical protein LOTGIDRAFT_236811 [Lottia gigantea]XP_009066195.1 hypothetical protein LOTGIDRAFT_176265 [Lottia gigantea]ESO83117.1 hypothetical protein LOTGIDRAFT_176265 [Lottia gigantea]ESO83234.1 hypothetical protein LOTGIDRAFT_236811 [Lottia gigantea]